MIILRPMGGMGNQMFQYAAAKTTAKRLGTDLLLDLGCYEENCGSERPFALDCFNLPDKIAGFKDVIRLFPGRAMQDYRSLRKYASSSFLGKFSKRVLISFMVRTGLWSYLCSQTDFSLFKNNEMQALFAPIPLSRVYYQKAPYYTSDFITIPDNTYMIGLWESNKFWNNMRKEVSLFFSFDDFLYEHVLLNKIRETQSVSIHVRRGDKAAGGTWHLPSSLDYIKSAIQIIETKIAPTYFIFSDDMDWCKEYLPFILRNAQYYFVENLEYAPAAKDLYLMTQCKHNIVAPSTFSWWGAWLNSNPNKLIIAPHRILWGDVAKDFYDLYPEDWIILK